MPDDLGLVASLITWLKSRAQPNSGIDFEADSYKGGSRRTARTTLWGEDARFIAEHFHGRSAADLAAAIKRLLAERDEAREALKPFAIMGELTDHTDVRDGHTVMRLYRHPSGERVELTRSDFRRARQALQDKP